MSDFPERWKRDVRNADIATLDIPASAQRRRLFEIDVRFVVRTAEQAQGAWHELTVELDGQRQWQRRIDTNKDGLISPEEMEKFLADNPGPLKK